MALCSWLLAELSFFYQLPDFFDIPGYEFRTPLPELLGLFEFFPVRRIEEVEMNDLPTLNRFIILLEFFDHGMYFGIGLIFFLFFDFALSGAENKPQRYRSPAYRAAGHPQTGQPSPEGSGYPNRRFFIGIEILPENPDRCFGSIHAA